MNGKTTAKHIMVVPGAGNTKTLGKIGKEVRSTSTSNNYNEGPYTSGPTALKEATLGTYGAINNASTTIPNATAPHGMNEFHSYDHNASYGGGGKIVCSMMNNFYGTPPTMNKVWLKHSANMKNAKIYALGYHTIFLPLVNFAKKEGKINYIVRKALEEIAINRTLDLKAEMEGTKRNTKGRIYRFLLEPLSFCVGYISEKLKKRGQ